jgi:hypothetical protein
MITLGDAIYSLGIRDFIILGEPATEEEFNTMFRRVITEYPDRSPDLDDNPVNFGVTWQEAVDEQQRLEEEYQLKEYQRQRQSEYPPLADLADAVYWQAQGDDSKMTAYLAAVQAVKDKYPKGNE